ncbi:MAG: hypothetical protein ACFFBD_09015 [Candidatus Hodarchaeota archaeon]
MKTPIAVQIRKDLIQRSQGYCEKCGGVLYIQNVGKTETGRIFEYFDGYKCYKCKQVIPIVLPEEMWSSDEALGQSISEVLPFYKKGSSQIVQNGYYATHWDQKNQTEFFEVYTLSFYKLYRDMRQSIDKSLARLD